MITNIIAGILFAVVFAAGIWGWWYEVIGSGQAEDMDEEQTDQKASPKGKKR